MEVLVGKETEQIVRWHVIVSIVKKYKSRKEESVMRAATSDKGLGKPSMTFK